MIQRPTPDRMRTGRVLEIAGLAVIAGGAAVGLSAVVGLTWEGAGGQYVPQTDMLHWALAGFGGPMTSLFVGMPLYAAGKSMQGK